MTKSANIKFIIKLSLILFLIVFVATLLLTVCNYFTIDRINQIEVQTADNARRNVIPNAEFEEVETSSFSDDINSQLEGLAFVSAHKATTDGSFSGYCITVAPKGFGGAINMIVGVTPDKSCSAIEIVSMAETPGLGAKAQEESFISQFSDNKKGELQCVKNKPDTSENEISAISGATITSQAVVEGVNNALEISKLLEKEAE